MFKHLISVAIVALMISSGFASIETSIVSGRTNWVLSLPLQDKTTVLTRAEPTAVTIRADEEVSSRDRERAVSLSIVGYVWNDTMRPVFGALLSGKTVKGIEIARGSTDSFDSNGFPTGIYFLKDVPQGKILITIEHQGLKGTSVVDVNDLSPLTWLNFTISHGVIEPGYVKSPQPHAHTKTDAIPTHNMAAYAVDKLNWNESTVLPLVAYLSPKGDILSRMYDTIVVYQGGNISYAGNNFTGPNISDFYWFFNSTFIILDMLENVSGKVKLSLKDNIGLMVVLTVVYFTWAHDANWSVDQFMQRWVQRNYSNLKLLGFFWMYSEGEIDATYQGVRPTADYVHSLGLKFYWCPFFLAPMWSYWRDFGFDYVIMQPNYAWNPIDPWRFWMITYLVQTGEIHGLDFELAYTRNNNLTVERNANIYLDTGFKYGWWRNPVNFFFYAPGYLDEYALGGKRIPPYFRPIYDRQYQFIHLRVDAKLKTIMDAYVFERPIIAQSKNTGFDRELMLRSDRDVRTRMLLRFEPIENLSYVYNSRLNLYVRSLEVPCLVAVYMTDGIWAENSINWGNSPRGPSESGLVYVNHTGWNSLPIPRARHDLSFALVPDDAGCNALISSKEGAFAPFLEIGYYRPVDVPLSPVNDAYVTNLKPSDNFGNLSYLLAGRNSSEEMRSYLRFDTVALPSWSNGSTLLLWASAPFPGIHLDVFCMANSSWTEMNITWSDQPNGKWIGSGTNMTLQNSTTLRVMIGSIALANPTFIIVEHPGASNNWVSFHSRESNPGPLLIVTLQAFERQF